MALYFLGSSAIVKRYFQEPGHAWIECFMIQPRAMDSLLPRRPLSRWWQASVAKRVSTTRLLRSVMIFPHWYTGRHRSRRPCLRLDFTFGLIKCLWNSGVPVECGRRKAHIKAQELYFIAWSISLVVRPSLWSTTVHFDRLIPASH
jgi:hypothetical protein